MGNANVVDRLLSLFSFYIISGIWPCLSVIDNERSSIFHHLNYAIGLVTYFNSIESFFGDIHDQCDDPHFVVLCNSLNVQHSSKSIHHRVRKLYLYCPSESSDEYYAWSERHRHKVSVLQYAEALSRLIIWDLSACVVDI